MSRAPLAVFDADAPTALAFTSSVGRAGVPVHVYSHQAFPPARASRYCTRFERCPDLQRPDEFLPWLERRVSSGQIGCVAPTSDLVAYYLAEVRDRLPASVQRALPVPERTLGVLFKERFAGVEGGFQTPLTFAPRSVEEAHDRAHELPYPAVLKPRSHIATPWERGTVVDNADELRARYRAYRPAAGTRRVLARHPELSLPLVQEYVPGAKDNLWSVSGLLAPDGSVVALAGSKKSLQWPPDLGVGLIFECWHDDAVFADAIRFVRAHLETGLFELEIIRDARTGQYVAIDLNPRAYGQVRFDMARGNDLPLLWYRQSQGERVEVQPRPKDGMRWMHSFLLHVRRCVDLAMGPDRLRSALAYLDDLRGPRVDVVRDAHDPLPSLVYTGNVLRHPGGLIRPFVRAQLKERRRRARAEP